MYINNINLFLYLICEGPGSALARTWTGPQGPGQADPRPGPAESGPDLKGQGWQNHARAGPDRPMDSLLSADHLSNAHTKTNG